jgi:hypothetical protein
LHCPENVKKIMLAFGQFSYAVSLVMSVLCGRVTSTRTLRGEHRLRVLDVRLLMKIFGTKEGEVTGGWRKIH